MRDIMPHMHADVLAANDAFYRAFNERDIPGMEALWASEAPVRCIHPGWNTLDGREDVLASWRAILSNPQQGKIVAGGAVEFVSGDVAIVTCRELVGGHPLAATNVFIREGGAWRLVHHHSSPVMQVSSRE
jgi:ketosteroid isomerase-like protein